MGLNMQFKREFKAQLNSKSFDELNSHEVAKLASSAAKKVYGPHPELMRQKLLNDLQNIPIMDQSVFATYSLEESLDFKDFFEAKAFLGLLNDSEQEGLLPIFYTKQPEKIALMIKGIMVGRSSSPTQIGEWAMVAQFLPDKVLKLEESPEPTLVVQSHNDVLFVMKFKILDAGLLSPISIQKMKSKL